MKPFFSIILPTFNQANFLKVCIKSILSQTYKNWELIIIDNNSTDSTQKIIKSIHDDRIRVFKINNKGLLAKSRNFGIKKAKSEWICFIDSDDKWFPEKLMWVKSYMEVQNSNLYYHDLVYENKGLLFKKITDKSKSIKKPFLKYFAENGNPIGQSSVVVRKKIFEKINYISENKEKFSWEDFDAWIKISKISDHLVRIPIVLGSIWIGSENISNLERQIINSERIKKYYYKTFNKCLSQKDKNKNLWWLEYPLILQDFRTRNSKSFLKRIGKISSMPIKFYFFISYMTIVLMLSKIFRNIKKIFTIIIFFQNIKKKENLVLSKVKYKKIENLKNLKKIKFNNFKIPDIFYKRIRDKNVLHYLYQKKNFISFGWSSNNQNFLISEINCEIINNKNIIFFDFHTIEKFRKKGFYKILLKKMSINFRLNNCYIYTTLFNIKSLMAINKSNFNFKNFFTVFKKKINLND